MIGRRYEYRRFRWRCAGVAPHTPPSMQVFPAAHGREAATRAEILPKEAIREKNRNRALRRTRSTAGPRRPGARSRPLRRAGPGPQHRGRLAGCLCAHRHVSLAASLSHARDTGRGNVGNGRRHRLRREALCRRPARLRIVRHARHARRLLCAGPARTGRPADRPAAGAEPGQRGEPGLLPGGARPARRVFTRTDDLHGARIRGQRRHGHRARAGGQGTGPPRHRHGGPRRQASAFGGNGRRLRAQLPHLRLRTCHRGGHAWPRR